MPVDIATFADTTNVFMKASVYGFMVTLYVVARMFTVFQVRATLCQCTYVYLKCALYVKAGRPNPSQWGAWLGLLLLQHCYQGCTHCCIAFLLMAFMGHSRAANKQS